MGGGGKLDPSEHLGHQLCRGKTEAWLHVEANQEINPSTLTWPRMYTLGVNELARSDLLRNLESTLVEAVREVGVEEHLLPPEAPVRWRDFRGQFSL